MAEDLYLHTPTSESSFALLDPDTESALDPSDFPPRHTVSTHPVTNQPGPSPSPALRSHKPPSQPPQLTTTPSAPPPALHDCPAATMAPAPAPASAPAPPPAPHPCPSTPPPTHTRLPILTTIRLNGKDLGTDLFVIDTSSIHSSSSSSTTTTTTMAVLAHHLDTMIADSRKYSGAHNLEWRAETVVVGGMESGMGTAEKKKGKRVVVWMEVFRSGTRWIRVHERNVEGCLLGLGRGGVGVGRLVVEVEGEGDGGVGMGREVEKEVEKEVEMEKEKEKDSRGGWF